MATEQETSFFDAPYVATFTLIAINSLVFAICLIGNDLMAISSKTLFYGGAVYTDALTRKEYWRFVSYAFLHANIVHLGMNMLCLTMWATILERRVGAANFLVIYFVSAVAGGLASLYGHAGPFISVGASGAISGVVGALLALTLLGKLPLPPQFFVVTIGLNAALIAVAPNIDWMAHLGGLLAGLVATGAVAGVATTNNYWLRCKFPEFLKIGLLAAVVTGAVLWLPDPAEVFSADGIARVAALALAALLLVKGADLLLLQLRGLAVAVVVLALLYASLPIVFAGTVDLLTASACYAAGSNETAARVAVVVCRGTGAVPYLLAAGILVFALVSLSRELRRGWNDVGFIRNSLTAARNRSDGI